MLRGMIMGKFAVDEKELFRSLVAPEEIEGKVEDEIFANMRLFFNKVPKNIFTNEYYALYEAIKSARKYKVILNYKHFNQILINNIEKLINSPNVIIEDFATDLDNKDLIKEEFIKICSDTYIEISNMELQSSRFPFNLQLYVEAWAEEEVKRYMVEMYQILTEGKKVRGKFLQGVIDADKYYRNQVLPIYNMLESDGESLSPLLVAPPGFEDAKERMKVKSNRELVAITGVESIDEDLKGLYRGDFVLIQGPPGGGKTRFTVNMCYQAVIRGKNGLYFALEDTPERYIALFLSRHLIEKYKCEIPADDIFNESYHPDYKPIIDEAFYDLFFNDEYGKFEIIPPPLFDDDIEELLSDKWDNLFEFSWVVIDYTSLISSRTSESVTSMLVELTPKLETMSKSFKGQGFLLMLPHQLTAGSIEDLISGKNTTIIGSADSKAVMRSAQVAFTIYTDDDLRLRNKAKIFCTKARHSGGFGNKEVYANLGVSLFLDLPDE